MATQIRNLKKLLTSKPIKNSIFWGPLIIVGFVIFIPLGILLVIILAIKLYRDLKKAIKEASNIYSGKTDKNHI